MSENREAKLRERASEIDADAHDNYCGTTCPPDDSHDAPLFIKRVLDALRQTEEEARHNERERIFTISADMAAGHDHNDDQWCCCCLGLNELFDRATAERDKIEALPMQLARARAEGERAGREAEREACAKIADAVRAKHHAKHETAGATNFSEGGCCAAQEILDLIRARGSE